MITSFPHETSGYGPEYKFYIPGILEQGEHTVRFSKQLDKSWIRFICTFNEILKVRGWLENNKIKYAVNHQSFTTDRTRNKIIFDFEVNDPFWVSMWVFMYSHTT